MSNERCLVLPLAKALTALFWVCSVALMVVATVDNDTQMRDVMIGWAMLSCAGAVVSTCRLVMKHDHRRLAETIELHLLMAQARSDEVQG